MSAASFVSPTPTAAPVARKARVRPRSRRTLPVFPQSRSRNRGPIDGAPPRAGALFAIHRRRPSPGYPPGRSRPRVASRQGASTHPLRPFPRLDGDPERALTPFSPRSLVPNDDRITESRHHQKNPLVIINQAPRRGSVSARAGPKPGVDGVPYVATNRFVVPDKDPEVVRRLVSEIESREKLMKTLPGYTSSALASGPGEGEFSFTQEWETKQAYEDYMNHPQRRRSHMAAGVYQYLPKDKWSVPENFTPILPTPK